jgi:hypothetical protein
MEESTKLPVVDNEFAVVTESTKTALINLDGNSVKIRYNEFSSKLELFHWEMMYFKDLE